MKSEWGPETVFKAQGRYRASNAEGSRGVFVFFVLFLLTRKCSGYHGLHA